MVAGFYEATAEAPRPLKSWVSNGHSTRINNIISSCLVVKVVTGQLRPGGLGRRGATSPWAEGSAMCSRLCSATVLTGHTRGEMSRTTVNPSLALQKEIRIRNVNGWRVNKRVNK